MAAIKEYYHDIIENDLRKAERDLKMDGVKTMLKFILIALAFIAAMLLSSCSAQWHLQKAIEKDPNIIKTKTFYLKETHKRDTLIFIQKPILLAMPRDTARIDSVVFKDTSLSFAPIIKKQGIVTISVEMNKGKLSAFATVDSTMIYNLRDSVRLKDAIIDNLILKTKETSIVIDKYDSLLKKLQLSKKISYYLIPILVVIRIVWYFRRRKNKFFS